MRATHKENHLIERIGWLRAAVLGANDGIISTASLILGVASAATAPGEALIARVAGLGARPGNRVFDVFWGRHLPCEGWDVSLPG